MKILNKPFQLTISLILLIWFLWCYITFPNSFQIIADNWSVTLTMVFGSFIAGATSEGGGAIAFPVFTKVLNISPLDAKIFSLSIQSIGMMVATLTIILMRISVEWRVILWASIGGVFGVYIGSVMISPLLPANLLKMLFTAMISSFALTLVLINRKTRNYNQLILSFGKQERLILLLTGCLGGVMTGLVGNGIDIISFSVMVLLFRLSEKVSTATSVVLMALNSLAGFLIYYWLIGGITPQISQYWLAAVPVVIIGAPLGAYFCTFLKNKTIAITLISLIVIELISSLILIQMTTVILSISLVVFLLFFLVYLFLSRVGKSHYSS